MGRTISIGSQDYANLIEEDSTAGEVELKSAKI